MVISAADSAFSHLVLFTSNEIRQTSLAAYLIRSLVFEGQAAVYTTLRAC